MAECVTNLYEESFVLQGARKMLECLRGSYQITNGFKGKEEKVYVKAELDMIMGSMDNVRHFLCNDCRIAYRNHKRDNKGRLIYVEAYFIPK